MVWSKHAGERCSRSWSVTTFLFKIPLYVYPRGNEQMIVGRKAQTEDLGHTQEKSGCRLLRLRIKIDAALPAQGPWDCIFFRLLTWSEVSSLLAETASGPVTHSGPLGRPRIASGGWIAGGWTPSSPDHEVTERGGPGPGSLESCLCAVVF